eukprot:TRINITY_DN14233_c0_g3_i1.p1 TRINITY_DN14233_c0_g3~~TRINITY_DN14233_c0_g3_i1.p1  ORF type:complete len:341 (+),score=62.50 TRINITY_DN14233_c0_g3_i1:220-1242(+)
MAEQEEGAIQIQRVWRGKASRAQTMARLEDMMLQDVDAAASRISTRSTQRPQAKAQVDLLVELPDSAGAPRVPSCNMSDFEFKNPDINTIKQKMLDIQCQASRIQVTVRDIAPAFDSAQSPAGNVVKPFAEPETHPEVTSLNVAVLGFTESSRLICSGLCRAGVGSVALFLETAEHPDNAPGQFVESLKDYRTTIQQSTLDPTKMAACNLILVCMDTPAALELTKAASEASGAPWILVHESPDSATFRFQYFLQGVLDVLEHDVVVAPTVKHLESTEAIQKLQKVVQTVNTSAQATFVGILVHSILQFWLGQPNALGYVWYSAPFNKFSTIPVSEIRRCL